MPRQGPWWLPAAYARSDRLTPGAESPPIDPAIHSEHNRQDRNPDHALPHPHQGAVSRNRSMRGEPIASLAGARTAKAIVPVIEPDDRHPGHRPPEGHTLLASRCRRCACPFGASSSRKALVPSSGHVAPLTGGADACDGRECALPTRPTRKRVPAVRDFCSCGSAVCWPRRSGQPHALKPGSVVVTTRRDRPVLSVRREARAAASPRP